MVDAPGKASSLELQVTRQGRNLKANDQRSGSSVRVSLESHEHEDPIGGWCLVFRGNLKLPVRSGRGLEISKEAGPRSLESDPFED